MDFGVLLLVGRQRCERDLFQRLSELDKDQFGGLIGKPDLDSARHDRLHDVDAIANSRHAVTVDLNVARHKHRPQSILSSPTPFVRPGSPAPRLRYARLSSFAVTRKTAGRRHFGRRSLLSIRFFASLPPPH